MGSDLCAFTYDGDTPQDARRAIRQRANIVLTNPDMLHTGILPHHTKWAKLFENLRYIVVDELHYYRGVYGSHLANIMRRLRRLCEFYGSKPQFIACSATIANPKELAETLIEAPFDLIDRMARRRAKKSSSVTTRRSSTGNLGIRRSYIGETRRIALELLDCNQQTLVFANNRLATEMLVTYLKDACDNGRLPTESVRGYRGGYLPRERREIEKRLRSGDIRAVVATNALELGIDVGSLDAVVMAGYPGTIASTWQRAGRAGRRNTGSLADHGGIERAGGSIRRRASRVSVRALAGTRLCESGQSRSPAQSSEVRGVRIAGANGRTVRPARYYRTVRDISRKPGCCTYPG